MTLLQSRPLGSVRHRSPFVRMNHSLSTPWSTEVPVHPVSTITDRYFNSKAQTNLTHSNPVAVDFARRVLRSVTSDDSFLPSVLSDSDGGVILFWKAGNSSIQIDLDADNSYYARVVEPASQTDDEWFDHPFPATEIRNHLEVLTCVVNSVNPNWRELF